MTWARAGTINAENSDDVWVGTRQQQMGSLTAC